MPSRGARNGQPSGRRGSKQFSAYAESWKRCARTQLPRSQRRLGRRAETWRPRGKPPKPRSTAAREAAEAEVTAARDAADAEVARWEAHARDMERWARAEVSTQQLTIPIPPVEVRVRMGSVESTIDTLYQIDHVMEVVLAEDAESQYVPDLEYTRNLTLKVQERAKDLSHELANLSARYSDQPQMEAAAGYAVAAGDAYRALLQRVDAAVQRLGRRFHSPDAEIIEAVTAMLADLRAQGLY